MTERHPREDFAEADAEFSIACRAFNEAADRLHAATQKRSAAWCKLRDLGETAYRSKHIGPQPGEPDFSDT